MRKRFGTQRAALVLICASMLVLATSGIARANFTSPYTTQCSGGSTGGIGTSLQVNLASQWRFAFQEGASSLACPGTSSRVVYAPATSSSAVLAALGAASGVRNPAYRFAGNEEPPTLEQWLRIDLGDKPLADSGLIRQIPVATTAVVPLVHFPEGCAIPSGEATSDGRFVVSNAQLEKVYAGVVATWGELLPDIASSCASTPIKRVVPGFSDGTTFVIKQWLNTVNPSRGWPESVSQANTAWPNDSGATATVRAEGNDRGEARLVAQTNGSIGYASLSDARAERFGFFSPANPKYEGTGLFWLSLQNGAGERVEPTRDPDSGENNILGANCDNPTFNYVPSGYDTTVTPVWRGVSAAGSKTGWPACTLIYDLAWDDSSTVFGNTEEEQAQQRTVKDFVAYVLGPEGQEEARNLDYSPLPSSLLADAQDGQARVGWNKIAGSKSNAIKTEIAAAEEHANP